MSKLRSCDFSLSISMFDNNEPKQADVRQESNGVFGELVETLQVSVVAETAFSVLLGWTWTTWKNC